MLDTKDQAGNKIEGMLAKRGEQMANKIPLFPLNISLYPVFAFLAYLKHELLMTGTVLRHLLC